ncbi:uncharacterized mitochondrial protein AtMg00820-like [Vicia villosa]|uniref:uncharacterized mitochondrial protein AtMg00820-like n=1 Tax=Vicia villosa TaxID=3911 RepID=UPI00273B3E4F|nr:uncharacterized mitochondrial protein AtMg00820-like [Vicia villosa]
MTVDVEPNNIDEALKKKVWVKAKKEELKAVEENNTWELTVLLKNKKAISMTWTFKIKLKPYWSIAKHKTRLVARGFIQKSGLDYFKVFASVARRKIIRLVIAIAANRNWPMLPLDVKSAILNDPLQ